jgi:Na+-driven multidrug efflux pump
VIIGGALIVVNGILVFTGREFLVGLFTNDPKVADNCKMIWTYM